MKPSLIPGLLGVSMTLLSTPALAQQDAPSPKKEQRIVIKKQAEANQKLLQRAAELSAKAAELAAAGDSQAASKMAAEASKLLAKAQQVQADVRAVEEQKLIEKKKLIEKEKKADDQHRYELRIAKAQEAEKLATEELKHAYEQRVRLLDVAEHNHDHGHDHGHEVEHELRIRLDRAHADAMDLHKEALDRHRANAEEHRVHLELLHEHLAELNAGEHLIHVMPHLEKLADGSLNVQIHTELEDLADLGEYVELENMIVDLTDARDAIAFEWDATSGDVERLHGAALQLQGLESLRNLEGLAELKDLEVHIGELGGLALPNGEARAYALALPGGETNNPFANIQIRKHDDADCDCECEAGCGDEREAQAQVMRFFGSEGGQAPHAEGHARYLFAPDGENQFMFAPDGENHFFLRGGDGQEYTGLWTTEAPDFPMPHGQGEHEVHVLRRGDGGNIEIHGGDGHQTIIIEGRVMMHGQQAPQVFGWHAEAPRVEFRTHTLPQGQFRVETAPQVGFRTRVMPTPPTPPTPPAPPAAPKVQKWIERTAPKAPEAPKAPKVEYRALPRDASAPKPSKLGSDEAQKLIREMQAEMETLRQELSDLRRQMKDDPLVQARQQRLTERNATPSAPIAVADRRRAGIR